jgi:hypothetical protein
MIQINTGNETATHIYREIEGNKGLRVIDTVKDIDYNRIIKIKQLPDNNRFGRFHYEI